MPERGSTSIPSDDPGLAPRFVKYAFLGAIAGLIVGVVALFLMAMLYGESVGLSSGACALFACSITMLLSQPAGVAGMVVGAVVGAIAGGIISYLHHRFSIQSP